MRLIAPLLLGTALFAAETPPVRGILLERDAQPASGQFSVRLPTHEVLRFQFDPKTYVERDQKAIDIPRLKPGEKVEVAFDPIPDLVLRYARSVHVIADAPPPPPAPRTVSSLSRLRSANRVIEERFPSGNLTYSGVVSRMSGERLVLHTRDGREQALVLRKDTRYLLNGDLVDPETLKLNTRVFVRAGKDLWDQIEAYQVIWGKILAP
jgi:hypothetical protein